MAILNQFAKDHPDCNSFVHGVACTSRFDLDVGKVVFWLMNFPPNTVGPSGGYELNRDGTCIKNASIRTLVETLPLYMAIAGVVCAEFAFLLMSQSAVIDRHPYQLDAQAGKGKKKRFGVP
jgi:hypothetical protein